MYVPGRLSNIGCYEQVVPAKRGKKAYQSQLSFSDGRMFLVRGIVDDRMSDSATADREPATVITVYRSTKVRKYWRSEP